MRHSRRRGSLQRYNWAGILAFDLFEFLLDLLTAHLSIPRRGLDRRCTLLGDMTQVVGNLFNAPSSLSRPMGEIVPEVMECDIMDEIPLLFGGLFLESLKP